MHVTIEPKVLYFGTPVVLVSTLNEDGTTNLAPCSSAWWLGRSCMLGMGRASKTVENLLRNGECVLNLPSGAEVGAVDRLALTTGKEEVPDYKGKIGCVHVKDKFERAGLTPLDSVAVGPKRVRECPVQLEGRVRRFTEFEHDHAFGMEIEVVKTHVLESLLDERNRFHIDSEKWRPLIMSFCEFYGLGDQLHASRLARVF
jgi:flavin reductase (DIM6/NTAB) family NADH-FMN oxidoreductase RutF